MLVDDELIYAFYDQQLPTDVVSGATLERWYRECPAQAVLALDEFPYLVRTSPELPSVVQRLLDRAGTRPAHLVLCGSSQRMMQGLLLDATAPLYGRAAELLLQLFPLRGVEPAPL